MSKLKMYKPNGREIEINDVEDAAKTMMLDGWRLTPPSDSPVTTSRRRKVKPTEGK